MATLVPPLVSPRSQGDVAVQRPHRLLGALDDRRDAVRHLGPNWFASVMGTGIVANAAALLPRRVPGLDTVAIGAWALAATMLMFLTAATVAHWVRHPAEARAHASNPAMAPFYGAPPMAMLTVGAGALLAGHHLIGMPAAIAVDAVLWTAGTLTGLAAAVAVPYLMVTRHALGPDSAFGGWLMPVVPPMVSAATGAALIGHLPAGQAQVDLLVACYALFGLSLLASVIVIALLWSRLIHHGAGPAHLVPTLWIVLGPLGQSITAANLLAGVAPSVVPAPYGEALQAFGVVYGVPVFGFAMLWLALAAAITVRTARSGLPFSLTWWSFTFPVGTTVTGISLLAVHTGSSALAWIAMVLYAFLLGAWLVVGTRTLRGAASGRLLAAPGPRSPTSYRTTR
jgi:C4-dicarboxylate transporter/malic acid transport protein